MNNITATGDDSSMSSYDITMIGIFVNLAINLLMLVERVITKVGKSECHVSHSGIDMKVDNSKENP